MVLNVRRFSWSAIFFYMYTSRIAFSPIRSQGATKTVAEEGGSLGPQSSISNPPQISEAASASPLKTTATNAYSPKSVYALASKVRSLSLCCRWNRYRLLDRLISLLCATSHLIISSPNSTKRISFKNCSALSPLSQSFHISSWFAFLLTFFL